MQYRNRRVFMLRVVAASPLLAGPLAASAQAASKDEPKEAAGPVVNVPVKETDAYPKSMGFKLKTTDVDQAKFPRHEASQKCSECQLYSGKAGDTLGPCSFFKKMVPPDGWCRNFKPKKAA